MLTRAIAGGAGALAVLGGAGIWFQLLKRPLPKTAGRLRLRGVDAPLEILRDRYGVPHVSARTPHDLCFALGFCHGQDRLWQLEFFRRATAGRLSEFAGSDDPARRPPDAHHRDAAGRGARGARRRAHARGAGGRVRGRHQRGDRRRVGAADRVPARAPRARAVDGHGPARLGEADGLRPVDELGDGAAAGRDRARGRRRAGGPPGAAVPARQPDRDRPRRRVRRRRHRPRGADRGGAGSSLGLGDAGDRLEQLGRLRRAVGDRRARCSPATRISRRRSPTSGTRPTSPATTTACAAPRCRPTRSRCSARTSSRPGGSRT